MPPVDSNPRLGEPNIYSVVYVLLAFMQKIIKEIVGKILGMIRFVYK